MSMILIFKMINGSEQPVTVKVGSYKDGSLAVRLICANEDDNGLPFCEVTKNNGGPLSPYCAAVKSYSENEGTTEFLINNGLAIPQQGEKRQIGCALMPVFQFSRANLQALDPAGCEDYERALRKTSKTGKA